MKPQQDEKLEYPKLFPDTNAIGGIKTQDGVYIFGDHKVMYGCFSLFTKVQRVFKINECTMIGFSGDVSQIQSMKRLIDKRAIEDFVHFDGYPCLGPAEWYNWLRMTFFHNTRAQKYMDVSLVIGGMQRGEPFLGFADAEGGCYEDDYVSSEDGFEHVTSVVHNRLSQHPDGFTHKMGRHVVSECMYILHMIACGTQNEYTLGVATAAGVEIEGPIKVSKPEPFKDDSDDDDSEDKCEESEPME